MGDMKGRDVHVICRNDRITHDRGSSSDNGLRPHTQYEIERVSVLKLDLTLSPHLRHVKARHGSGHRVAEADEHAAQDKSDERVREERRRDGGEPDHEVADLAVKGGAGGGGKEIWVEWEGDSVPLLAPSSP